jgi:hypothetical protein
MTPLKLSLSPAHAIAVQTGSDEQVVPLTIAAGPTSQYFDLVRRACRSGRPGVRRDKSARRARLVDGQRRGTSR